MKSFPIKILVLFTLVFSGIMLANLVLLTFANINGLEIKSEHDLLFLLDNKSYAPFVKLYVGLSHVFTFIVFPVIFIFIFYKNNLEKYLDFRSFKPMLIILFPLALFSLYPLMGYMTQLILAIELPGFLKGLDENAMESMTRLLTMDSLPDLFINLLIIGILPGIGEELLFRGILQKELIGICKNNHFAIWVTAIIFSAFHFQITGFPAKMLIGLVLGYSYYYSVNLLVPMFLHTLNNSMATLSFYLYKPETDHSSAMPENIPLIPVIAATLIFFWIMSIIKSLSKLTPSSDE